MKGREEGGGGAGRWRVGSWWAGGWHVGRRRRRRGLRVLESVVWSWQRNVALSLEPVGGRDLWETEQKMTTGNLIRVDQTSLSVARQVCQQCCCFFFYFRFTSVSGSVCVRVISTSGAFSPYAAAVGVGLWPLCAPREDSMWTKQPLKRLQEERNSHEALLILACLLAGLQLPPPLMSEGDANDVWMQKLKPIYLYVFIYFILFVLRVQQDHTPRSKFTLIQHCWYWYFKYCIYSCIFNTDVCIIHVLYIYVREVKWFVYSARLLLLGRSLLQLISKLSNKSEN